MMFFWLKRRQIIPMTMLNWKQHSPVAQVETDRHYVTRTHAHVHTHTHTHIHTPNCKTDTALPESHKKRNGVTYRFSDIHFNFPSKSNVFTSGPSLPQPQLNSVLIRPEPKGKRAYTVIHLWHLCQGSI